MLPIIRRTRIRNDTSVTHEIQWCTDVYLALIISCFVSSIVIAWSRDAAWPEADTEMECDLEIGCMTITLHVRVWWTVYRGALISPNPRLPSFRKSRAPIFPNCFLLKLLSLRIQLIGGVQFLWFLLFFKTAFLTFKCQILKRKW